MIEIISVEKRTTPNIISELKSGQVFVFGSNISGVHGKGAARKALDFGARWGHGNGMQGMTYGIPTKDKQLKRTLSINEIKPFVDEFITFARINPKLTFLVTEIGCGLAGHKPKDIAPLFLDAEDVDNIYLPSRFWKEIKIIKKNTEK